MSWSWLVLALITAGRLAMSFNNWRAHEKRKRERDEARFRREPER